MLHLIISRVKLNKPDKINGSWVYGVCHCDENDFDNPDKYIIEKAVSERSIIGSIKLGAKFENACLSAKGELKGTPAALSRLDTKPWLVLSRMCYDNDETIGYRIISPDGKVKKCRNADILRYCDNCVASNKVPFQNAIYHPKTEGAEAHIKSYPERPFPVEIIERARNRYAVQVPEPAKPQVSNKPEMPIKQPVKQPEKLVRQVAIEGDMIELQENVANQIDLFTPEQKKQIKLGIQNNVNASLYADPAIDWQKMKILRKAMQNGFDVRPLVTPAYIYECSVEALMYMTVILAEGIDVRQFLNPKYTMAQLSELHVGYVSFLDINQFADPNLSVAEMIKAREQLEKTQWGTLA